jgi:secondary thiamine-phosphate synthase enzyme
MVTINIRTNKREEFIDITSQIEKIVADSGLNRGICVVFCPHTTAALTINEDADPAVKKDILTHLKKIVPESRSYTHLEGNSDSHIKSSLLGVSLTLIIENKSLALGTWQGIYFCEFDGPRNRKVFVRIQ